MGKDTFAKFLPLGVGLCCLGKQEMAEATVEALAVLPDPFKSMAMTMVDICAYAGTGNVLKIQSLLHICSEHFEPEKTDKETEKWEKILVGRCCSGTLVISSGIANRPSGEQSLSP